MVYAATSHNRTVYAAPAVAGLASVRLGRCAPTPHSSTFLLPWKPTVSFIGQQKRRKRPERYVPLVANFSENDRKMIDKSFDVY
jgi:hypothetical protein